MPTKVCECCDRTLLASLVSYESRRGFTYCIACHDADCDPGNFCELWAVPPPAGLFEKPSDQDEGPTEAEMAEVYASFGVAPPTQTEH